jgi:hypothetical protein
LYTVIQNYLRTSLYRDTAHSSSNIFIVTDPNHSTPLGLYRDSASRAESLYLDGKNRAVHSLPAALDCSLRKTHNTADGFWSTQQRLLMLPPGRYVLFGARLTDQISLKTLQMFHY